VGFHLATESHQFARVLHCLRPCVVKKQMKQNMRGKTNGREKVTTCHGYKNRQALK